MNNNPYPGTTNPGVDESLKSAGDRASDMAHQAGHKASDMAREAGDRASDMARQAKEKASEFGRTAVNKLDQGRQQAASALENTAHSLRSGVEHSGARMSRAATATADRLQSTADYMRQHDMGGMMNDAGAMIKRNPGMSLIAACAVGFLLGSAMRKGRY